MPMRVVTGVLVAAMLAFLPAEAAADPRSGWYASGGAGYWSDGTHVRVDASCQGLPAQEAVECSLEAFRAQPFTVIAFVDTGINPYAHDFYAPDFMHHPAEYIDGYPTDADVLDLTIPATRYETDVAADAAVWEEVEPNRLYWIPGTRIIGAVSVGGTGRILDSNGHGTGVASVAAGRIYGAHPNALIVAIEGLGDAGLRWAAEQPWIDIVSNSWGPPAGVVGGNRQLMHDLLDTGKVVVFSAGNGVTNTGLAPDRSLTITNSYKGAAGVIPVGAVSPVNGQSYWWHSIPPEVSSFGRHWPAAHPYHTSNQRNFGGTSCAAPITAGVLSAALERARALVGDTDQGPKPEGLAVATTGHPVPASGPLADGVLTRNELRDAVLKTAYPAEFRPDQVTADPYIWPTTPAHYPFTGYGIVDRDSKARALDVLDGSTPLPERPEEDAWMEMLREVRQHMWKPWPDIDWPY